ncbi:MAG: TetR/AcrR family transcriptional regulator [Propionibacteriaceae bacterium]
MEQPVTPGTPVPNTSAPTPGPRSGGYAKGNVRRDAIVAAATELFGRVGYRTATMVQVADVARISRAGLLHHFPTKERLLEAVLAARDRIDHDRVAQRSGAPSDGVRILADLVALVEHNATIPAIVNLYAVLSAEAGDPTHPAHAYFVARYATSRRDIEHAVSLVEKAGRLRPGTDPATLAVELIALMDGLQVQWLLAPDTVDMAAVLRHRIDAALTVPLPITTQTAAPDAVS